MGKTILAACFITDWDGAGARLAFRRLQRLLLVFVVVTAVMLWFMPKLTQFIITKLARRA